MQTIQEEDTKMVPCDFALTDSVCDDINSSNLPSLPKFSSVVTQSAALDECGILPVAQVTLKEPRRTMPPFRSKFPSLHLPDESHQNRKNQHNFEPQQ